MEERNETFGSYLRRKRLEHYRSLRETAAWIGVTPQYYCDVERDIRTVFAADKLASLVRCLVLTPGESARLYDLAAESRNHRADVSVPQDFAPYIVSNGYVAEALRVANNLKADAEDWQQFVEALHAKKG